MHAAPECAGMQNISQPTLHGAVFNKGAGSYHVWVTGPLVDGLMPHASTLACASPDLQASIQGRHYTAGMRIARSASKHTRQALHGRYAHRPICKQAHKAGITRQACASPDLQASIQGRHHTAGMRIARSARYHCSRHTRQVCASPDLHVGIVAGIQGRYVHTAVAQQGGASKQACKAGNKAGMRITGSAHTTHSSGAQSCVPP